MNTLTRKRKKTEYVNPKTLQGDVGTRCGDIKGFVKLKDGQTVQVKLDDLKQFIEDNHGDIATQKIPNMVKRRV